MAIEIKNISVKILDILVVRINEDEEDFKLSGRLPGATRGRDNLIIKATKPRGKKVFQIVQYPSGRFSSAVGR